MKTDLEPWKSNLEPWKTIKTNLNHWKPIKTEMEPWKTNLEPSKLTWSCRGWLWGVQVVTGDSQEEVIIFRDKQTHMHHNIYITLVPEDNHFSHLYPHLTHIILIITTTCPGWPGPPAGTQPWQPAGLKSLDRTWARRRCLRSWRADGSCPEPGSSKGREFGRRDRPREHTWLVGVMK